MRFKLSWVVLILGGLLVSACGVFWRQPGFIRNNGPILEGPSNAENGERIYYRAASARGSEITYRGGSNFGGMMMGSNLTCATCHGPSARGGSHTMHMQVMDAPDITYAALSGEAGEHDGSDEHSDEDGEYSLEDFRQAVIDGNHPDGESLNRDMPRWQMSDDDLADLLEFLKEIQ
jgi:cytochrome c oxidase subunit 2